MHRENHEMCESVNNAAQNSFLQQLQQSLTQSNDAEVYFFN